MDNLKKVLIILPYENLYPPANGGIQTCFNMIHSLAKKFNVIVVTYQEEISLRIGLNQYNNSNRVTIFSIKKENKITLLRKIKNAIYYRLHRKKIFESADSNYLNYLQILPIVLKENIIDFVIVELLTDTKLYNIVKKKSPKTKFIYQNHNVDSDLAFINFKKNKISKKEYLRVLNIEKSLKNNTDLVMCVSSVDEKKLQFLNNQKLKTTVINTGIKLENSLANQSVKMDKPIKILFCGSLNYDPNINAIIWFYNNCWSQIIKRSPELKLIIIGSGNSDKLNDIIKNNSIDFKGYVENVWDSYNDAAIVIVPLLEGSGIRIKILEAMSMGVPIVSTSKGAEGIKYLNGKNILIADNPEDFIKCIFELLTNKVKRIELSTNARNLIVNNYQWEVVSNKILSDIIKL
jgi:glycosyltransferase involved in cell wall biosynthesis